MEGKEIRMSRDLLVMVSLDVEEEGLFSGSYPRANLQVGNVSRLPLLEPISREMGFPLTLFCAYSVFADSQACAVIRGMKENSGAEIGAHLHHWSTPPLSENPPPKPERSHTQPPGLFASRLETLLETGRKAMGEPLRVFRMGRWDLKAALLPVLSAHGIIADSSICPLRAFRDGPNHFAAPADPYWLNLPEGGRILEAPITQVPLFAPLARFWQAAAGNNIGLLDSFHFFGAMSVNPFWHGEAVMRQAVRLHAARGGRVINMFWHSSEMQPGCSPHVPDEKARDTMLRKIFSFLGWLKDNFKTQGITLSGLARNSAAKNFPAYSLKAERDW